MSGALKAFQQRMAAAVMAPLTARETMARRRADGGSVARDAAAWVKPNARLSSFERLEIYNRQYWFRVLASMGEDFPGLRAVLGRTRFHRLVRDYLVECPSRSYTLRNLGSRLPDWLAANPRWRDAPRGSLALAMARLEWAHIEAFDEADLPPAAVEQVTDATRLALQPHLRLLQLDHPVDDLLIEVHRNLRGGDAAGHSAALPRHPQVRRIRAPEPEPVFLAVHRYQHSVHYKRMGPEAFGILQALQAGAPLGAALEAGFAHSAMAEAERPRFLRETFHEWAVLGWFARISDETAGCP
ncbi:MAG: DNA-binding domain-containing protein [Holophaga sp.]|nr:DNA-binding domain-containing protein [Holophaga sp.]